MAKALQCTVITTVGDDNKMEKAKALGADHVINYRKDRFETITRKLTQKKGVDVVFEHVGGEGFNGSLLVLKRGGRLVTCGSTAGPTVQFNLMQLFQQQYKIFGSFGATMKNIGESLDWIAYATVDGHLRDACGMQSPKALNVPFYIFDKNNVADAGSPAQFDTGYGDAYVSGFRKLWGLDK